MQIANGLPYTLGLDIGMASVGAALLLPTEQRILALHVRTFDKAETAKEGESLNKIRRDARLTRRRLRRRAHRLLRLARLMKRVGLIASAQPDSFAQTDKSPWELRAEGLDRLLEPKEWAAVLYHLLKHRGFQSSRKSEAKADEKVGQMLSGVKANKQLLKSYRSVGELVALDESFKEAKRNKGGSYSHTFDRADLNAELHLLFQQQRAFQQAFAEPSFEAAVHGLLMARRPVLSGANLLKMIGKCTFEKSEDRAPRASYRAERFVWLGKLNNLKIVGAGDPRPLTEMERRQIVELPYTLKSRLTFKQVRKALTLEAHQRFNLLSYRPDPKGKDKDPEDSPFFEAKYFHTLRKAYEEAGLERQWQRDACDPDRLDALAYALTCYKDDNEAREWMNAQKVEPTIIEAVLTESFDSFIHLSQKALKHILPHMEAGQRYDEAAKSAGYEHSRPDGDAVKSHRLSAPDRNTIINPVVYRALNQARKLVNAIIDEYGPPAAVHIELARDLSKPKSERDEIAKEQKNFRAEKEQAAKRFIDDFHREPRRDELQKMRLYREQGSQCAYCQGALDIEQLFATGYTQIDHALPFSRSFDDSQNNKVLVHTKCNQDKGDRTPYEYLDGASDSQGWQRFVAWVQSSKAIRQTKRNKLLRMHFGAEEATEFRERNLNDTRYICREFKRMVETQLRWHPDSVQEQRCVVVAGQLTALLRARWGLLKVREEGDLHHALDAAVIAGTSRSLVKRMADYSRRHELETLRGQHIDPETGEVVDLEALRQVEAHFPSPWPQFRDELLARLSANPAERLSGIAGYDEAMRASVRPVRVSRAPTRRGLGAAHEGTVRSTGRGGGLLAEGLAAAKVALRDLKFSDLEKISGHDDPRNSKWIQALRERLQPFKEEDRKKNKCAGAKAFAHGQPPLYKPSAEGKTAPQIRSVMLLDTQKSGLTVRGGIADNGDMLRTDIFRKGKKFHAVPIYVADAVKAELPNLAVVASKPEQEWTVMDETAEFLFSLHPNDWLKVKLKGELKEGYFSGLDRATGAISLWTHDRNQFVGKDGLLRGIGIKTALDLEKYHVDLLGNLHRVHKEQRQPLRANSRKK